MKSLTTEEQERYLYEFFTSLKRQDKILDYTFMADKIVIEMYKYIRNERFNKEVQRVINKSIKSHKLIFS